MATHTQPYNILTLPGPTEKKQEKKTYKSATVLSNTTATDNNNNNNDNNTNNNINIIISITINNNNNDNKNSNNNNPGLVRSILGRVSTFDWRYFENYH